MNSHDLPADKDFDLHRNDPTLVPVIAAMTEDAKAQTRRNMRELTKELRATLRPLRDDEREAL